MPRFESYDGTRLSYEVDGDGPVVLLLHGYVSDSYINWVRPGIIDRLKGAGYQTVALDQRGHGLSEKPHELSAYADGAMVRDARGLLDHLEVETCLAAGYSMGARNVLDVLSSGEVRIRAAVLGGVGGNMLASRQGGDAIAAAMEAQDKSTISNAFAKSFRDFADLTKGDRVALAAVMRQPREPFTSLEKIGVPVLVLVGDNDPMIGDPNDLVAKLPSARASVVGGSHLNVINNPQFASEMLAFLDEHRSAVGG